MTTKTLYLDSTEIKTLSKGKKKFKIAGYANTVSRDRTGDVIVPNAWTKGVEDYRKNPVLLLQHKHEQPIGRITNLRLDKKGIYVEAEVSDAAERNYGTQTLIDDGALKAFSVGFRPKRAKYDRKTDTNYITDLELLEISVVSIPCNQDSLFSVRKSFDNQNEYKEFLETIIEKDDIIEIKAAISEKSEDGHYHTVEVDANGNGSVTYTSHFKSHTHEVKNFEIQPAEDGHTHDIKFWKDSTKVPEMEIESLFDETDKEIILINEEKENMSESENKTSDSEVTVEEKTEEVTAETKAEDTTQQNAEESTETVAEEKANDVQDEKTEESADTTVADVEAKETSTTSVASEVKDDEENKEEQEDPYAKIPFVNMLSMSTSELKTEDTVKVNGSRYSIKSIATQADPKFTVQPIDVKGEPTGEETQLNATELSVVNSWDLGTKFDINLVHHNSIKSLTDGQRESIKKSFDDLVTASEMDLHSLKSAAKTNEQQVTLNNVYNLKSTNSKDWNDTNYALANRVIEKIKALQELPESDDRNLLLKLHGCKTESPEEKKEMATQNADEPMVVNTGASAGDAPEAQTSVAQVREPEAQKLLDTAQDTVNKHVDNQEIRGDDSLSDQVAELMQQIKKQNETINALQNSKMVYQQNNDPSRKAQFTEKEMANAVYLAKALGKNDSQIFDTKFGAQMKAITTVDQFLSNFSSTVYEEMQQQLVITPMLERMQVDARTFRIPVADEDTDGDVAQFASGTFATGAYDTTRVPTSNQHTMQAVEITPHKFMATTHLAKDEQEDTVLPLVDFLRSAAARRVARAIDKALLRGDGSLTGFTASPTNAITAGTGYASVMKGLVTHANDISGLRVNTGASTTATPADIASARAKLGKYGLQLGNDLVYLTTIEGYNDLVQTSDFRTVDKLGPNATYLTGSIGAVYGIPVVITEFLDNASTNDDHIGLLLYKPGFMIGERRAMEIESEYNPRQQVTAVYMSTRFDMKPLTTAGTASAPTLSTRYSYASVVRSA